MNAPFFVGPSGKALVGNVSVDSAFVGVVS